MARISVALLRDLESQVCKGEITYSKMVEILNEQVKLNPENTYEYYKVSDKYIHWKGNRFFRFKYESGESILQVCLETNNEVKKGKGHYIGIYKVSRSTFFTNWYPNYVVSCSELEFYESFEKAIIILKT